LYELSADGADAVVVVFAFGGKEKRMNAIPTVFCLSSGRSGTHFLYEILRRNLRGAVCRHEPYVWNPSMFGRPIYDRAVGDEAALRRASKWKRRAIERHSGAAAYIETSHAFLKSWSEQAIEYFPGMKLVHLVRSPLAVARSEAVREELCHRWGVPFRNYRGGDGQTYFRWALTGREPIFAYGKGHALTRLQWYVLQWIEIENRAMAFLDRYDRHADCFTLRSPVELNDPTKVEALLEFLELPRSGTQLALTGRKNRTPGVRSEITPQDQAEFAAAVRHLPPECLAIFARPPYCAWEWSCTLATSR
jgi:hypothetical protein